jgi:hypothetical protein
LPVLQIRFWWGDLTFVSHLPGTFPTPPHSVHPVKACMSKMSSYGIRHENMSIPQIIAATLAPL